MEYEINIPGVNLDTYIEKSNKIYKYCQLCALKEKWKLQNLVFPDGVENEKDTNYYRNSKINHLFGVILSKSSVIESNYKRKGRPSNVDESSFLVDNTIEISNLDLFRDLVNISDMERMFAAEGRDY